MSRISFSQNGKTPFENLIGHNPTILEHWDALERAFLSSPTFSEELKEQVRRTLAFLNQCDYCMAKGKPAEVFSDKRTELAVQFAKRWKNHLEISDRDIDSLRKSFTDAEIAELCSLISFFCASQRFGSSMGLRATCRI